jgi:hypothetical protein
MLRRDPGRSNHSSPPNHSPRVGQSTEYQLIEITKKHRWLVAAVAATYRYLSEGVRDLGKTYSTYDDRNIQ